ncbi:telomere length regulation protein-domain-containing protein [Mycena maculata]|uniref:Telomere length regulation protein-domain-containing protein n=1 Tax=Mycena maculata TaxID=230809 RepID=A0AAD7N082_9AGAR|nr:telomere length regulation protein-domain-containing protein [Mycena maculata]
MIHPIACQPRPHTTQMQVEEVLSRLQTALSDVSTLLGLLCGPLDCISLLPPQFRRYNTEPLPPGAVNISRHVPALQRAILQHIGPTWESVLAEKDAVPLLEQYFCPDPFSFASPVAGDVTLLAYSTILSLPLTEYSVRLLVRLSERYPIDRLHSAVFSHRERNAKQTLGWEDCVRNVAAVPAKVANALQGKGVPPRLEHGFYFNALCKRCECIIPSLSPSPREHEVASLTYLLTKLVNVGAFPATPPSSRSQPSFFQATLHQIRTRFSEGNSASYSAAWGKILRGFTSSLTLQSILTCLFGALSADSGMDSSPQQRATVKRESLLLLGLLGPVVSDDSELWEYISAVILTREWSAGHARIFVCWVCGPQIDLKALELLLNCVVDMWSSRDHVKHSLLNRHQYLTTLLLVTLSYFPSSSPELLSLALSPSFVSGVGIYIGHLDNYVRRCGMLAAEVVAQLSGKKLDFGDWEGDEGGKAWARKVRQLLLARDLDANLDDAEESVPSPVQEEIDIQEISTPGVQSVQRNQPPVPDVQVDSDSDDSLTGYVSQSSSRSASPTPSELAEIEKDPTLGVGVKKVPRPVYLAQLGALIRPAGGLKVDENQLANEAEMGINCAEELIRKKKGYGTELDENAVNLVHGLLGLQNNYELEGFSDKRQGALNALVSCAPRVAAPCIIEEFFKNQYSTDQRYAMLNALALGGRELASLSIPPSSVPQSQIAFPSKTLPIHLHQKYLENQIGVLPQILDDISRKALDRDVESNADKNPEIVRERRLRVRKPPIVTEVQRDRTPPRLLPQNITFNEVAAQYFIAPLINRFWLFFRDEQMREERTAHQDGRQRYHGAGTGLILNPVVLSHFLATLAILVHASKNAPEWLALIGPEALELAVTLGTKPVSIIETDDDESPNSKSKEAAVLSTALELTLIVLDGCLELDGGRALGLDHTALLLGAGEWANAVFSHLDKGAKMEGGGGVQEVKLKRAAAGVLLKVESLASRWRRSMIDTA